MHARPVLPNDQMPSNALSLFVPTGAPTQHSLGLSPGLILGVWLGQQSQIKKSLYAESPPLGQCPPSQHEEELLLEVNAFIVGKNIGKKRENAARLPSAEIRWGNVSGAIFYIQLFSTTCLNISVADFHAIHIIHILIFKRNYFVAMLLKLKSFLLKSSVLRYNLHMV